MNYLVFSVSRDRLLVGKTRDWLIGARQLWRSFVILKHANAQYSAHPQTPLPTTKPGLQGRDWNHSRREF